MTIGIDASRAFLKKRTGIEEYSYQVIRHLRSVIPQENQVILYVRKKINFQTGKVELPTIDFDLPRNWEVRGLWAPRFWTQVRLSLEMLFRPVEVLFVPAHTVPFIHPKRTVVTIHGLEYEFSRESYSWYERSYMRFSIRKSVRWASWVIAVSENTKQDLMKLYGVPAEKITVIHEGADPLPEVMAEAYPGIQKPYFLFVGRVEERKNVVRIIEAFDSFQQKTGLSYRLVLAGKPGYGYERIQERITKSQYQNEIYELGYVTEEQKWQLLKGAEALLFPSLYEGFGLPVIEAQQVGTPVITSTTSSLPEIAGKGAILVDPLDAQAIAEAMERLATDPHLRAGIIDEATRNADRFSWDTCSRSIAQFLLGGKS